MKNILNKFLENKKITIPITVVVICLIAGGIVFGVTANSNNKDNATTTASADVKEGKQSAAKNTETKKADTKDAAETDEKDTASSDENKSANNASDTKSDTPNKKSAASTSSANGSSNAGSNTSSGSADANGGSTTSNNASGGTAVPQSIWGRCPYCGEQLNEVTYFDHDCPYTTDAYGNVVSKNSRYVVAVGGFGTKKYSDGTYEVTDWGREANRNSYNNEILAYQGAGIELPPYLSSLDAFVIDCSGF